MNRGLQTGPAGDPAPGNRRPLDKATKVLLVILAVAIVESFVHYTDNTLRYDDYTADDPSLIGSLVTQWMIPVSWVLFTAAAVLGYRELRRGNRARAAAWIGAYSASGLISALHYVDISPRELSAFQNTFVFLDIALGTIILAFAVWLAWSPEPGRQAARAT
jgi:hypothetical protein